MQLIGALDGAGSLADRLLAEQLETSTAPEDILRCARIIAARPPKDWNDASTALAQAADLPIGLVRIALASAVQTWNADPRAAATNTPEAAIAARPNAQPSARPSTRHPKQVMQRELQRAR